MSQQLQGTVLVAVGAVLARLVITGGFTAYVKLGLRVPLLLAAGMLVLLGLATVMRDSGTDGASHSHDHDHGPPVGLLVLLPVVAMVLITPTPLGSFAADRSATASVAAATDETWPALGEPTDGAVDVTIGEVLSRALHGPPEQLEGHTLRLVGFATPSEDVPGGYLLSRFTLSCCAADALALQIAVRGEVPTPPADTWMEVEAVWRGGSAEQGGTSLPLLEVVSQRPVPQPDPPYEY